MPPVEPAPRTERAGPIVIPPMAQPAPSGVTAAPAPPSPHRKRGGGLAWVIAGSLILGAAVVGTLVVMNGNVLSSSPSAGPTTPTSPAATPPPTTLSATPPAALVPSAAPVAPLATSPGPAAPAAPHSGGGHTPHTPSPSPTDNPFGGAFPLPAFPFPLDGGALLPFTIPSAFPTALPSGLPFTIPGFPTAAPKQPDEPPPAPSAKML
jgi:hypothetical protein